MWTMKKQPSPIVSEILLKIENLIKTLDEMKLRQAHSSRTTSRSDQVQPAYLETLTIAQVFGHSGHYENEEPSEYDGVVSSKVLPSASNVVIDDKIETVKVSKEVDPSIGRVLPELQPTVLTNISDSYYLLDNKVAAIGVNGGKSYEIKFCVDSNIFERCLLPVCENASVYLPFHVAHGAFNHNWYSIQLFHITSVCPKPPWKPPDNRTHPGIIVSILLPQTHIQNEFKAMKCVDVDVSYGLVTIQWVGMTTSVEFNILLRSRVKLNKVNGDFEIWNEVQFSCYFQFQWPGEFGNAIESSWYKDMSSEGSDYVPSKEFKNSGAIYTSEGFSEFNELSDAIEGPKELMCLFFSHRKSRADSLGFIEYFENDDGLQELCGGSSLTRDSSSCKKNNTSKDEYSKLSIIQCEIQLRGPKMCPCSPDKESGVHGEVWRTSDLTIHDPKPYDEMNREVCISSMLKYIGLGITGKAAPKIHGYVFVINDMSSSSDVYHGIEVILHKKKIMFARILQVDNAPEFVAKISIILMEMFMGTSPLWCQSMQAIYSRNVFRPSVTIGYTSYDTICNPQEALLVCSRATRVALGKTLVVIMFAILVGRDGSELLFTFDCFGVQFLGHIYHHRLYSRCDCFTLLCVFLVTALLHLSGSIYLKIGSQACISPEGKFTKIPSDVIGGSTLGSHLVAEALVPDDPLLEIRFVNNIDAAGIDHQIAQLGFELASTLVLVILRSGSTLVTENG